MTPQPEPEPTHAQPLAPESRPAASDHEVVPDPHVSVTVVRSGGFAGLTRRWGVQAPPADAQWWCTLVEACPWDDDTSARPTTGADRFSWSVQASLRGAPRRAELTESEASGPWRTLIDAVREASESDSPTAL